MSATAPSTAPNGAIACPRCAATIGPEQEWCLACGDAARTRLVPTPSWKAPIAIVALIAAVAGLALAVAFVELTGNDPPVTTTAPGTPAATTAAPVQP